MRWSHRPAAAVELLDHWQFDLSAIAQLRMLRGEAEPLTRVFGLPAVAQCAQSVECCLELSRLVSVRVLVRACLKRFQLSAEAAVEYDAVLVSHGCRCFPEGLPRRDPSRDPRAGSSPRASRPSAARWSRCGSARPPRLHRAGRGTPDPGRGSR